MTKSENQWIHCECICLNGLSLALAKEGILTNEDHALIQQAAQEMALLTTHNNFLPPPKSPIARVNRYLRERVGTATTKKFLSGFHAEERYDLVLQLYLANACVDIIADLIDLNLALCKATKSNHIDPKALYKEIITLKEKFSPLTTSEDAEQGLADFVEQLIHTATILLEPQALLKFVKMFAKIRTKKSLTSIFAVIESFVEMIDTVHKQLGKTAKAPVKEFDKLYKALQEEQNWSKDKIEKSAKMIKHLF
jgi:hypothetical protein